MAADSELEKPREKEKKENKKNNKLRKDKKKISDEENKEDKRNKTKKRDRQHDHPDDQKSKKKKKPKIESSPPDFENNKNKKDKRNKIHKKKKIQEENKSDRENKEDSDGLDGRRRRGGAITDERFASAQWDPRFQRVPRRESKVVVDARFARMFTDESFGASSAPVDKRGRPRKEKAVNPLLHYYLREEEPEAEPEHGDEAVEEESASGSEPEAEEEEELGLLGSDADESSSTDEEEDFDDDEYSVNSEIVHYLMANHDDTPTIERETHRLAVVNLDWDHIKAADIYVVMNSCLPKSGQILSVAIYPSEYGLKCMETEAVHGPSGLFDDNEEHSEDETEIDNDKLRTYELNKLRYCYAVVVCDSSATANHIYKTLDGTELLKTSNVFDLRFIPDSMEFKHPPRDIITEAPISYKEPDFHTRALQHSKVKLSWEEDEPQRTRMFRRKFNPDQLDELEEYLASTDDGSDDDDENDSENDVPKSEAKKRLEREKLLALLESGDGSDADNSDDKDMEITFNAGLEDLSKRILEKKDKKSETVWEAVLRKKREKKAARKKWSKDSSDDDSSDYDVQEAPDPDQPDDFFVDESLEADTKVNKKSSKDSPKTRGKSSRKGRQQSPETVKEQEASRAELELLFVDDQDADQGPKGYNLKPKKVKGKKGKKELPNEDKLPNVDVSGDLRFSALFSSHLYALDPTDPQFKRSAAYARQQLQKHKMGVREKAIEDPSEQYTKVAPSNDEELHPSGTSTQREKFEFSSTIRSLKRNSVILKK